MSEAHPAAAGATDAARAPLQHILSEDVLQHILESLSLPLLGKACQVCHAWNAILSGPRAWQRVVAEKGFLWGTPEEAERSALGWKSFLKREQLLERRWLQPAGLGLRARVISCGHRHWVPSVLMHRGTRELVTCSYDGTICFWHDADAAQPRCFKRLTASNPGEAQVPLPPEGFSCIGMHATEAGPAMLAAGSELGNVHVWEVWRREDESDAQVARRFERSRGKDLLPLEVPPHGAEAAGPATVGVAALAVSAEAEEPLLGEAEGEMDDAFFQPRLTSKRPHFVRKLATWTGHHDFIQSIIMMSDDVVVSGGDAGGVLVHRLHSEQPSPMMRHEAAVMCLDASDDGTALLSGSVDHTIKLWDLHAGGKCTATFIGHSRSVHCLSLGKATPFGPSVIFSGSRDHTIKLWDMRTQRCEQTLYGHKGSVTCIGSHGWKLLSGGGYNRGADDDEVLSVDASLRLWDLRRLRGSVWSREAPSPSQAPGLPPGDPVLSLQILEDKVLTSHGGKRWTARIWDLI